MKQLVFDIGPQQRVPFCSKSDCKHKGIRCQKRWLSPPDRLVVRADDPCVGYVRDAAKCMKVHRLLNLAIVDEPQGVSVSDSP